MGTNRQPIIRKWLLVALCVTAAATTLPAPPTALAQVGTAASGTSNLSGLMGGQAVVLPDAGGTYDLKLPVSGAVQRLQTRKGARVVLKITGPKAEELHLHGYDIKLRTKPGETSVMEMLANRSGRFELETHNGHRTVLILEVMP